MVDSPSLVLAFAAGLVSFLSPCSLPLVPGYLAAVAGRPVDAATAGRGAIGAGATGEGSTSASVSGAPGSSAQDERTRTLARALLFVATFSAIFILLGLSATALGALLFDNQLALRKVAGVTIIALGAVLLASLFVGRLNRDFRPFGLIERAGAGGPVVAGAAFALAWTPCVGPTLAAILGLASTQQSTLEGGLLLLVYSAGLALPFLFAAVAFDSAQRSFGWFKRHYAGVQAGSGILLVGMGVLVLTGTLFKLNIEAQKALDHFGLNFFQSI